MREPETLDIHIYKGKEENFIEAKPGYAAICPSLYNRIDNEINIFQILKKY